MYITGDNQPEVVPFHEISFVPSTVWLEHRQCTRLVARPTSLCHHFGAERICEGFEHPSLQIEVAQIILHKTYDPDVIDLFDVHGLTPKDVLRSISSPRQKSCRPRIHPVEVPALSRLEVYRPAICVYACRNLGREIAMVSTTEPAVAALTQAKTAREPEVKRNLALDAYRGFVMLLMMAEVLRFAQVAATYPNSVFWKVLAYNQTHVEWFGCSLHDTIQPGFSFLVGAALPYSLASRMAKGARFAELFGHALWRSLVLVALGVFLRSMDHRITYFTFEDTLSQIGLGYPLLFLIAYYSARPGRIKWVWSALAVILVGYWLLWALYPAAPANFDWKSVGVSPEWN